MFGDVRSPNSLQVFGYANGNPLLFTDPLGERAMTEAEKARDAEQEAEYQRRKAAWEAMPWYKKAADFFKSDGNHQGAKVLARNINAYRDGIDKAADGEDVTEIDVGAEYGQARVDISLPSGTQNLSAQPLVVPASQVGSVQAQRQQNRETLDAVTAGPAAATSYAIADAAGASAETKANVAKTVALAESTAYVAAAFAPGNATAEMKSNIARDGQMVTGATPAPRRQSVGAAAANDPALASPGPPRARFEVTPSGVAIPTNPGELKSNLGSLKEASTNPSTSRKFVGADSQGPIRVRIEKAHPADPNYTGVPDPLHTVDHLHIDRRANGQSGPWGSGEKVPYDWPF